jgi:hypothetical protein
MTILSDLRWPQAWQKSPLICAPQLPQGLCSIEFGAPFNYSACSWFSLCGRK